jgi:hypothetical protein
MSIAPWLGGTLPSLATSLVVYLTLTRLVRALAR